MSRAFDFKELVSWCARTFDLQHIMIQFVAKERNPILLTPNVFMKLLQIPTPNKNLRLVDANSFLDVQGA
jgi:hypothetical protein